MLAEAAVENVADNVIVKVGVDFDDRDTRALVLPEGRCEGEDREEADDFADLDMDADGESVAARLAVAIMDAALGAELGVIRADGRADADDALLGDEPAD